VYIIITLTVFHCTLLLSPALGINTLATICTQYSKQRLRTW